MADAPVSAVRSYVGVGVHPTSLTDLRQPLVARTAFARVHDWEFIHDDGAEFEGTSGSPGPEDAAQGDYDTRFRGTLEGTVEGAVPYFIRSAMGAQPVTTTVGVTGKQHVFDIGDSIPLNGGRMSLESKDGTIAESEQGNGVCGGFEFQLNQAGYARWAVEGIGSLGGAGAGYSSAPTVASLPSVNALLKKRVTTFTFNGAATLVVRNLSWHPRVRLFEDDYDTISIHRRDTQYEERETTFDAELLFRKDGATPANKVLRDYWGGADAPQVDSVFYPVNIKTEGLTIPGGTAKYTAMLDCPKIKLTGVSKAKPGRDVIRQRITGRAVHSSSAGYAERVTIINTVASYA